MTKSRPLSSIICCSLIAAIVTMPSAIYAVRFSFNTVGCGHNGVDDLFTNVNITVSCGDNRNNSECLFGDMADIEGTVEATRNFSNSEITSQACVWKYYCPQSSIRSAGTLCDDWLSPLEDQTCGNPGLYSVSRTEEIPESDLGNRFSWLVTLNFGVNETCNPTKKVEAEESPTYGSVMSEKTKSRGQNQRSAAEGGYFMSYSLMGAIFGTAFGTVLATRKRCSEPDEYDDDDLFEERPFSFAELKDVACNA